MRQMRVLRLLPTQGTCGGHSLAQMCKLVVHVVKNDACHHGLASNEKAVSPARRPSRVGGVTIAPGYDRIEVIIVRECTIGSAKIPVDGGTNDDHGSGDTGVGPITIPAMFESAPEAARKNCD